MKVLRKVLYAIAALILLFVVIGVFLPSTMHVERQIAIDAHPATVFALIEDPHRRAEWSPWIENGDRRIVESVPLERVVTELRIDDKEATSTLSLEPNDGTRASWQFDMDFGNNLLDRYFGLFRSDAIGRDLERGLANLKILAESLPRADFSELQIEHMRVEPVDIAYLTTSSQPSAAAISEAMGQAFFDILNFMDRHGLDEAGPPLSITRAFSGAELVFDAAIPVKGVTDETPESENGVQLGTTYGGAVIRVRHVGSYRNLSRTHAKIAAYLAAHGIERNGDAWESYASDPTRTPEAELVTYVYYPIKSGKPGTPNPT